MSVRAPRRRKRSVVSSSSGRSASCGAQTRSCAVRRLSSRRSSTARRPGSGLHRRPTRRVRGRADRQGAAGRPSTYYAAKARPPSARAVGDAELTEVITAEQAANYGVFGARTIWKHLHRLGRSVGRCRVERLIRAADLHGVVRGRAKRTTVAGKDGARAGTWSTARSPRRRRASCGSPTLPTSGPGPASPTSPSSSTSAHG